MEENSTVSDMEIGKKEWLCNKCKILKTADIFPFGLEDYLEILNIMNDDSMKALENLPNYEIASKITIFESLKESDIDENIINLNSRYYPAQEFKSINKDDTFSFQS